VLQSRHAAGMGKVQKISDAVVESSRSLTGAGAR
jgi:hypothetical protein